MEFPESPIKNLFLQIPQSTVLFPARDRLVSVSMKETAKIKDVMLNFNTRFYSRLHRKRQYPNWWNLALI